uniref:Uncharacterized protein n=1 Tax=Avena sativa TaxID=4498 RepID=A0ACD5ZCL8_AVESA
MSPRHGDRTPPPRRDREHHPSFSAALLDAIYHSLDADADADLRRANVSPEEMLPPPPPPPACRIRRSTASSSSASSARSSPRSQKPPRPCRVRPHPQPPPLLLPPPPPPLLPGDGNYEKRARKNKRRTRSAPFACILNALLCNRKPPANSSLVDAAATRAPLPAIRAEPASARSILSSRASRRESAASAPGGFLQTPGRRAVRFSPAVEIVGDDEHGCHSSRATPSIRLCDVSGSGTEVAAVPRESSAEAERRVEELLRALGAAEDRERAKESSESSSDLFELDSLPVALDAGIGLPRTRPADLAPPRPRVLLDEMVV